MSEHQGNCYTEFWAILYAAIASSVQDTFSLQRTIKHDAIFKISVSTLPRTTHWQKLMENFDIWQTVVLHFPICCMHFFAWVSYGQFISSNFDFTKSLCTFQDLKSLLCTSVVLGNTYFCCMLKLNWTSNQVPGWHLTVLQYSVSLQLK